MEFEHEVQVLRNGIFLNVLIYAYKLDVEERDTPAEQAFPFIIVDMEIVGFPSAITNMKKQGEYVEFVKLVHKAFKADVQSLKSNFGE